MTTNLKVITKITVELIIWTFCLCVMGILGLLFLTSNDEVAGTALIKLVYVCFFVLFSFLLLRITINETHKKISWICIFVTVAMIVVGRFLY